MVQRIGRGMESQRPTLQLQLAPIGLVLTGQDTQQGGFP
jgi:hypothetical protein